MINLESSWVQAMSTASEEGLIFIEGTGPTYATKTVMLYACPFFFLHSFEAKCMHPVLSHAIQDDSIEFILMKMALCDIKSEMKSWMVP